MTSKLVGKKVADATKRIAKEYLSSNQSEDQTDSGYDYLIKVLLLGDSGVGKTCFLYRYTNDDYKQTFVATVGVDFRLKKLDYHFPEDIQGKHTQRIHLQLWDTAGQERYRSLTKAFFRDGMGFLLFFDITSERSFLSVRAWLNEIKEQAYCENPDIILVGNKSDLDHREVTTQEAEQFSKQNGITYIETSAKSGENVTKTMDGLVDLVMGRMKKYASQLGDADETDADVNPVTSKLENTNIKKPCAC